MDNWLDEKVTIERGVLVVLCLLWSMISVLTFKIGEDLYDDYTLAHYEKVEVLYVVMPNDNFWDITHEYFELDERGLYFLQYETEMLKYNPKIETRGGMIYPGDVLRIRYYRRK